MVRIDPIVRLTANENGETKCVIFVDSLSSAREKLKPFASVIIGDYPFISAVGACVNVNRLSDLASLGCVRAVAGHTTVTAPPSGRSAILAAGDDGGFGLAERLGRLRARGIDGRGVTCAVIDTGIRPHLDFCMPRQRVLFRDFVDGKDAPYDDNGHGTAVAGILGGNGLVCGHPTGAAPRCRIAALKAVCGNGEGSAFKILEAMQWIYANRIKYGIRVLNLSFGSEPLSGADPLALGAEALWKSGVTVIASAGNSGPDAGTVKSPGISPYVITVGGAAPLDLGGWSAADFSSRGPAGQFHKPDLLAPAVSVRTTGGQTHYLSLSGTSMAAPLAAGVCALILQKKPTYTPDRVKELLLNGAVPLGCTADACGRGLLSVDFPEVFL